MKNKVQLITYVDRFGKKGISELHQLLNDHLKGVFDGGMHLLPFFHPIDGADAGFDPIDHTKTDERIGSWEDITRLADEFVIMVDLVVNHISSRSKQFLDVKARGTASPYIDLFLTKEKVFSNGNSESDIKKIFRPRPTDAFTNVKLDTGEELNLWTTFTPNQLDIDVTHELGKAYLTSILEKFKEAGIKMIRLDATGYAIKKAGTSCFMIPETYEFIDRLANQARDLGMEVLVEIHSHFEQQISIAEKVDLVYDFALPPLVLHSIRSKRFTELKEWLAISPRNCVTVLDTHDGIGVVDVAKKGDRPGLLKDEDVELLVESIHQNSNGESKLATGASASNLDLYQVNCTFYDALGENDMNYLIARAIQFFSPGLPQVYYVGILAGENDLDLLKETKVGRDINRRYYDQDGILAALEKDVIKALIKLIKFRNDHPSFSGEFSIGESDDSVLILNWVKDQFQSELKVNLVDQVFDITYTDGENTQHLTFDNIHY